MLAFCLRQDADEGYTDALAGQGKKEAPKAPPTGLPAHFSMAGTAEHAIVRPLVAQSCWTVQTASRLSHMSRFRPGCCHRSGPGMQQCR